MAGHWNVANFILLTDIMFVEHPASLLQSLVLRQHYTAYWSVFKWLRLKTHTRNRTSCLLTLRACLSACLQPSALRITRNFAGLWRLQLGLPNCNLFYKNNTGKLNSRNLGYTAAASAVPEILQTFGMSVNFTLLLTSYWQFFLFLECKGTLKHEISNSLWRAELYSDFDV